MPVKIRLQRHGRKRYAYYHIVVADGRAPRDGRFIERLGSYNPNTNPATINLDFDKALNWLSNGAQPTDTCRAILSYKGVLMKKHLLDGVKKGAFDEAEAERRFNVWMTEKEGKIQSKKDKLAKDSATSKKERLDIETKINAEKAEALLKKKSEMAAELEAAAKDAAAEAAGEEATDEVVEEIAQETPVATEEPAAEPAVEEPVVAKEPAAETVAEEPKAEEKAKVAPEVEEKTETPEASKTESSESDESSEEEKKAE